jgi:hypothetical protein
MNGLKADARSLTAGWPKWLSLVNRLVVGAGVLGLAGAWVLMLIFVVDELV